MACLLHVFIWSLGQHTGRWTNGVMAPTVLASDRPLSESTDAGDPPKRVGSNEASIFFSASHAGLWHCKTNPMLHLVKTKPKKGNNNLDRTNLHEKWQFFWAMKQISTFRWEVAAEIKLLRRIWRPCFDMSCFLLHLGSWKKERDNEGWNKSSTSHDHYSIGKK